MAPLDANKIPKPLRERNRRARVNKILDQLKHLLVDSERVPLPAEVPNKSKLEKADILEMTVQYIRERIAEEENLHHHHSSSLLQIQLHPGPGRRASSPAHSCGSSSSSSFQSSCSPVDFSMSTNPSSTGTETTGSRNSVIRHTKEVSPPPTTDAQQILCENRLDHLTSLLLPPPPPYGAHLLNMSSPPTSTSQNHSQQDLTLTAAELLAFWRSHGISCPVDPSMWRPWNV